MFSHSLNRINSIKQNAIIRDGIRAATVNSKIVFQINENSKTQPEIVLENGSLIIQCNADNFYCNMPSIRTCPLMDLLLGPNNTTTSFTTGIYKDLPQDTQKSLTDNEFKKNLSLGKISKTLGRDITYEVDIIHIFKNMPKDPKRSFESQMGTFLFGYYPEYIAKM